MAFADAYLKRFGYWDRTLKAEPEKKLKYIIVIPVFNEDRFLFTLNSLKSCKQADFSTEVIAVINSPENSSESIIKQNIKTRDEIEEWNKQHSNNKFKIHILEAFNLSKKHAGAGLARKIGMDEAIKRFNILNNPEGIIISLDADSVVHEDYLLEIENATKNNNVNCLLFNFEHPIDLNENGKAIALYELYLRYYRYALRDTGFPYTHYTIGSCFAVRAEAYIKQGGMNKKQAGEDFYFLHKIFPLGKVKEISKVMVFPSSRISDRVPFGTGPMIKEISENNHSLNTYNFEVFKVLQIFLEKTKSWFLKDIERIEADVNSLHSTLKRFLIENKYKEKLKEIRANSSSEKSFYKRFLNWFDAFRIIKYLNLAHENDFEKKPVEEMAKAYLKDKGDTFDNNSTEVELLEIFRKKDSSGDFNQPLQ